MAAIIHRAGRKFNVDEADGVSRRDRVARRQLDTLDSLFAFSRSCQ
jgi:hypothetical protein